MGTFEILAIMDYTFILAAICCPVLVAGGKILLPLSATVRVAEN